MKLYHYGKLNGGVLLDAKLEHTEHRRTHDKKPRFKHVLWASPVDSKYGWEEWCEAENFGKGDGPRHELMLHPHARVLTIDSIKDLVVVMVDYGCKQHTKAFWTCIDWLRLVRDYDAVYLTTTGAFTTRFTTPDLYGWDCESVAIFRASACVAVAA